MRKILGAAAILLGCLWAAYGRIRARRTRAAMLLSVRDALMEVRRELAERQSGMKSIFQKYAGRNEGERTGALFRRLDRDMESLGEKSFSEIWRAALEDELAVLGEAALEILAHLGDCLGGSELALQCAAIERTAVELERLSQREKELLPEEKRMSFGLSLAAGAMLVIMLI